MGKKIIDRRDFLKVSGALGAFILLAPTPIIAQKTRRISLATGGTGGTWYPFGGGLASILSKYIPGVEVNAEVTAASVDNAMLLGKKKVDIGFVVGDVAYDAYRGVEKFKDIGKIPLRAVAVKWVHHLHVVTLEGSGINTMKDLRGRRVSIGAAGSGTEIRSSRALWALGIDAYKDIKTERLSFAESADGLKDRKIDAYFGDLAIPTASVLDLALTPGVKMKLIPHPEVVPKLREKYGPIYFKATIPKKTYPGVDYDVENCGVASLMCTLESEDENLIYQIVKVMIDHQKELVMVHKQAESISPSSIGIGSSIPFHSGALKYFKENKIPTE